MSRTYKHYPASKICGGSNKLARSFANRSHRRINRVRLRQGLEPKAIREVSDTWNFPSDGLAMYWASMDEKALVLDYISRLNEYLNLDKNSHYYLAEMFEESGKSAEEITIADIKKFAHKESMKNKSK